MKLSACDICYCDGEKLMIAETKDFRVDETDGEIDVCIEHQALLTQVLTQFFEVSRVAHGESIKRCRECHFTSVSQAEMNKHRRKHEQAHTREHEMSSLPPGLAATA